jgi:hypothetical protein
MRRSSRDVETSRPERTGVSVSIVAFEKSRTATPKPDPGHPQFSVTSAPPVVPNTPRSFAAASTRSAVR